MIIHRFVLNNSIHFIWENKKWNNLELHPMCISIMLQWMHLCIKIGYVQGVDQKYFWTWNKITHYSTIQRFKKDLAFSYNDWNFLYILWRIASEDQHTRGIFASMSQITHYAPVARGVRGVRTNPSLKLISTTFCLNCDFQSPNWCKFDENLWKLVMENKAFRRFEWSVWKLLDCRILHQIPKGFWGP